LRKKIKNLIEKRSSWYAFIMALGLRLNSDIKKAIKKTPERLFLITAS